MHSKFPVTENGENLPLVVAVPKQAYVLTAFNILINYRQS